MFDAEELLLKIHSGRKLKPAELEEVVYLLETTQLHELGRKLSVDDVYALLLVLGKTKERRYRPMLEKYLDAQDALTVSQVLETLCLEWGPIEEYVERLLIFALGNSWDEDGDVQAQALKILGEHLYDVLGKKRGKVDPQHKSSSRPAQIVSLLLGVLRDENAERAVRQSAYFSLCRAYGKPWEEIPSEFARLDLSPDSEDLDREVLGFLERFVAEAGSTAP